MLPRKYGPALFSLTLSCLMSLLVSGIATLRAAGMSGDFPALWLSSWLTAWLIAFPAVMLLAPLSRKMVAALVAEE